MKLIAEKARTAATQDPEPAMAHAGSSHSAARQRFDSRSVAARYPSSDRRSPRDQREWNCIRRMLEGVPKSAQVLDLPCGTGRMTGRLLEAGYSITAADTSTHMLTRARTLLAGEISVGRPAVRFSCCDVLRTPFQDDAFDAVVCNRLFHHFVEPEIRRAALRELARICRGPMVVSFFRSLGIDAIRFHLKHAIRGSVPSDRIPIPLRDLRQDVRSAGLEIVAALPTRWGISPQWYVKLARASG